jgi:3-phenylpropionate/trans-cinnamate dioxygenase ferredoxin reductase subunit
VAAQVDVLVVGNGGAGFAAAQQLARHGVRPLLAGPGPVVDRPTLTKTTLTTGRPGLLADAGKIAELGIAVHDGLVRSVDLAGRRALLDDGTAVEAGAVVLACGLDYEQPRLPGDCTRMFTVASPAGAVAAHRLLSAGPRRVVVVGAGLLGVESAATAAAAGHEVVLLDPLPRPLDRLHDPLPAVAAAELERAGVAFRPGFAVALVEDGPAGCKVTSADGAMVTGDVVLRATGGRARSGLAGLPPLPIAVGPGLAVPGLPGVHAAGDCAVPAHPRFGRLSHPHWDSATGAGRAAADAIAGVPDAGAERLPYWWSDIGKLRVQEVGAGSLAVEWAQHDGLWVGRDAAGTVTAVLVIGAPRRLREARGLVTASWSGRS